MVKEHPFSSIVIRTILISLIGELHVLYIKVSQMPEVEQVFIAELSKQ